MNDLFGAPFLMTLKKLFLDNEVLKRRKAHCTSKRKKRKKEKKKRKRDQTRGALENSLTHGTKPTRDYKYEELEQSCRLGR